MKNTRRKFLVGSVAGVVSLAGCMDDKNAPNKSVNESDSIDSEQTQNSDDLGGWNNDVWINPQSQVEAAVSHQFFDEGSKFSVLLNVIQRADFVWVVVEGGEAETVPQGGWFSDGANGTVGQLSEYGAVEGSVLLNKNGDSGGIGSECVINLDGVSEVDIVVYGAMYTDDVINTVDVMRVYPLSRE